MKKPIVITLSEIGETQHEGELSHGVLQVDVDGLPEDFGQMLEGVRKPSVIEVAFMRVNTALQGKAVPALEYTQVTEPGKDAIPLPASSNSNIDFN